MPEQKKGRTPRNVGEQERESFSSTLRKDLKEAFAALAHREGKWQVRLLDEAIELLLRKYNVMPVKKGDKPHD